VSVRAQEIEQLDSLENLADPSCGVHDSEYAIHSDRHVVRTDQFTHACRVDPGDSSQVQHDSSLATIEERSHSVPELSVDSVRVN
jgi:hypothetical protein